MNENQCAGCMEEAEEPDHTVFTEDMLDYTILLPTMLPMHFKIMAGIFTTFGYKSELLENTSPSVIEYGLKYVHNDTCYPAMLMIGQMIEAIESGKYDKHKIALMMTQTGGGCRASNYIFLLRKALKKAGYGYIPVISLNVAGLEKDSAFKLSAPLIERLLVAVTCGDLLMSLVNQVKPYEKTAGGAEALANRWVDTLTAEMSRPGYFAYGKVKKFYRAILEDFAAVPVNDIEKVRVGIVGEIFVKFSPLGNNELERFLVSEGAEVVMPGLLDFCMFAVYTTVSDWKLLGMKKKKGRIFAFVLRLLKVLQNDLIKAVEKQGRFRAPVPFGKVEKLSEGLIHHGAKMGEGWLLTAEMAELIEEGVTNIVCAQPFGCLPNHIAGKGMMKPVKEKYPAANIVAVDYDAGATRINQENRIKLMLSNAAEAMERKNECEKQTV